MMTHDVQDYAAFMLNTEGRVTSWNEGAVRIKGYSEEEVLGQHFSLFHPPEDIPDNTSELLALAIANGNVEHEGWRLRKDGSRFWAGSVMSAIRDETGKLIGFSRVTHDLTDRLQAAEGLRKANATVEMILGSITDRFFAFDSEWRFTYFNKHAEEQLKALGKDPASLIGKLLWEEFPSPPIEEVF